MKALPTSCSSAARASLRVVEQTVLLNGATAYMNLLRDTAILDPKELAQVAVTATVDAHLLGPKIRVFTYRAKHSSKKMRGHRSRLSKVTITEIALKKRAAARPRRKAQAEAAAPEGD